MPPHAELEEHWDNPKRRVKGSGSGIKWPQTRVGETHLMKCRDGSHRFVKLTSRVGRVTWYASCRPKCIDRTDGRARLNDDGSFTFKTNAETLPPLSVEEKLHDG
jgi:hypothetical protein